MEANEIRSPKEKQAQLKLIALLNQTRNVWYLNTTSGGAQRRGVPDILGVYSGRGFGVELKRDLKHDPTPLQLFELEKLAASGGMALIARGVTGAVMAHKRIIGEEIESTKWCEEVRCKDKVQGSW